MRIGISDAVPKLIAYRLLEPALRIEEVHLVCIERPTNELLVGLAQRSLDLVIADEPVTSASNLRAFNHLLGECGVSFFATAALRDELSGRFPRCLENAPIILPTAGTILRRAIDAWLNAQELRPKIVIEAEDSGLGKVFGEHGVGVFVGPTAIEHEVRKHHSVVVVGRAESIRDRFYAITGERRLTHPAIIRISETAHQSLFA